MRVALVCDWFLPRLGGIELHLHDLARRLGAAGDDVVVITPTPGPSSVDGVAVTRVDAPLAPRFHFIFTPGGVRAVGRAIDAFAPDLVHSHVSIVSPTAYGAIAHASRRGIPCVATYHSIVPATPLLMHAIRGVLGARRLNAVHTAVSSLVARQVRPISGGAAIGVLPNGIDPSAWRVDPAPRTDGRLRLVTAMRLASKKRPLALVAAMRRLADEPGLAGRVSLDIAGDGPLRGALTSAITRAGLAPNIRIRGRMSRDELRELYARSDLFVLPTVRESFGLAPLEARCAGLPVVAMARSGVAEHIGHEREGMLARDDDDFARCISRLLTDESLRARIATHNRSSDPSASWDIVLPQHQRVYRDALARTSSS